MTRLRGGWVGLSKNAKILKKVCRRSKAWSLNILTRDHAVTIIFSFTYFSENFNFALFDNQRAIIILKRLGYSSVLMVWIFNIVMKAFVVVSLSVKLICCIQIFKSCLIIYSIKELCNACLVFDRIILYINDFIHKIDKKSTLKIVMLSAVKIFQQVKNFLFLQVSLLYANVASLKNEIC